MIAVLSGKNTLFCTLLGEKFCRMHCWRCCDRDIGRRFHDLVGHTTINELVFVKEKESIGSF
jgi:hypothetical protein